MEDSLVGLALLVLISVGVGLLNKAAAWIEEAPHRLKVWRAERILEKKRRRNDELRKIASRNAELEWKRANEQAELERRRRVHFLTIRLQQALRQIPAARDFRRPASIAAACREVPLVVRQRLYQQHKRDIEEHATLCLQQRIDRKLLIGSLANLLQALGVARFEADYTIESAATRIQEQIPARRYADFGRQLQDELRFHRQRVRAIEGLKDEPDNIEQMLEIEHRRHADVLIRLTAGRRRDDGSTTTL